MLLNLLFTGCALAAVILIAWLVYRNLKDEKKFEQELDEEDIRSIQQGKDVHEKFDKFGNE